MFRLREIVSIYSPTVVEGSGGVSIHGWSEGHNERAHVHYLRGGESVMAGRLSGKSPVIFTVRQNRITGQIAPDWKVVYRGRDFNVREMPRLTRNRLYYEFLAEEGVAV